MVKMNEAKVGTVENVVKNPLYGNNKPKEDVIKTICNALKKSFHADVKIKVETNTYALDDDYITCDDDFDANIEIKMYPVVIIGGEEHYMRDEFNNIVWGGEYIYSAGDSICYDNIVDNMWYMLKLTETLKLVN